MPAIDATQRVADLRLRGTSALPVRVRWPTGAPAPAPLMVFLPDLVAPGGVDPADERLCQQLCAGMGVIVMCAPWGASLERAAGVLEWSADHAAELGGDPKRLVLAGSGAGAAACVTLALRACEQGWPRIARQLLVLRESVTHPGRSGGVTRSTSPGAPATVAVPEGRPTQCAERLRARGIDVDELVLEDVETLSRSLCRALEAAP